MPLPNPKNVESKALIIDGRRNAVTRIIQGGAGFIAGPGGTTVTIVDERMPLGDKYAFNTSPAQVTVVSATKLQIDAICTPPTSGKRFARGSIVISTMNPPDTTGSVPVVFQPRPRPSIDHTKMTKQRVRLKTGSRPVIFLPITGVGDVVESSVDSDNNGTWSVYRVKQLKNRLKITLNCDSDIRAFMPTLTSLMSITLITEDDVIEIPPIETEFVDDPEEDPDP